METSQGNIDAEIQEDTKMEDSTETNDAVKVESIDPPAEQVGSTKAPAADDVTLTTTDTPGNTESDPQPVAQPVTTPVVPILDSPAQEHPIDENNKDNVVQSETSTAHTHPEPAEHKQTGAETRRYLQEHVNDYLLHGMRWLATTRPSDGLGALAEYLQSAHRYKAEHDKSDSAEFHKYWLGYQSWKSSSSEKTEQEYKSL